MSVEVALLKLRSPTSWIMVLFGAYANKKETVSQRAFNDLKLDFLGRGAGDF